MLFSTTLEIPGSVWDFIWVSGIIWIYQIFGNKWSTKYRWMFLSPNFWHFSCHNKGWMGGGGGFHLSFWHNLQYFKCLKIRCPKNIDVCFLSPTFRHFSYQGWAKNDRTFLGICFSFSLGDLCPRGSELYLDTKNQG